MTPMQRKTAAKLLRFGFTSDAVAARGHKTRRRTAGYNRRPAGVSRELEWARQEMLREGHPPEVVRACFGW